MKVWIGPIIVGLIIVGVFIWQAGTATQECRGSNVFLSWATTWTACNAPSYQQQAAPAPAPMAQQQQAAPMVAAGQCPPPLIMVRPLQCDYPRQAPLVIQAQPKP